MGETDALLDRLAEMARSRVVGGILEVMAAEMAAGADILAEPELRDAAGRVMRSGPLGLPSRSDLAVIREGRTSLRRVDGGPAPSGRSIAIVAGGGFLAEVVPFRWDDVRLALYAKRREPDWTPLRRWFLEWFQTRHCEAAPDLLGSVHSMDGPRPDGHGWLFSADFGSAPAGCLNHLIAAVPQTGAVRLRIS